MIKDVINYRNDLPGKDAFFELFQTTGWYQECPLTAEELHRALTNSWYSVSVYDGDQLIGYGRAICDGVVHALVLDLIVRPDYQGRGIGRQILGRISAHCRSNNIRDVQLFCARGKVDFYEKCGYVRRDWDSPGMQLKKGLLVPNQIGESEEVMGG